MVALYEKLRPKNLDEFVGHHEAVAQIEGLKESCGLAGQAFWISGPSGTGKSTLARIIAEEAAGEFAVVEMDAQDLSLDFLRDFKDKCATKPLWSESHALIANEAHCLNSKTVSYMQTFLESDAIQRNATVIFTTTDYGQERLFGSKADAFPFISRCIMVELKLDNDTCLAFRNYLMDAADRLKLNGKPASEYDDLLVRCQGNMRMALQEIATGKMKAK
jgi:replication-associated recombination protein RarA